LCFYIGLITIHPASDAEVYVEELRRLRKEKGLSQARLAVMAGLDPSTVSQIETGARRANTRTLERLATVLETEVADLFPKGQAPLPLEPVPPERGYAFMAGLLEDWQYLFGQAAKQWSREANSGNLFGSRDGALSYSIAANIQAARFFEIIGERLLPAAEELPEDLARTERRKLLEARDALSEATEAVNAATLAAVPELGEDLELTDAMLADIEEYAKEFEALPEFEQRRQIREVEEVLSHIATAHEETAEELRKQTSA
jgi:transcriptional regulator with XRE-family HTH domain